MKEITKLELAPEDCGIIFRGDGKCELVIPKNGNDDEVTGAELLCAGLGMFLRDPKFIEMIKSEFIKNVQKHEKFAAEDDEDDKDKEQK